MIVIGGGAAGIFGAIAAKTANTHSCVAVLEKTSAILSKVKISGGGRCNVTHSCFDLKELVKNYPRGHQEMLGPFFRFGPQDTLNWFALRGVEIKKEQDGRMFPTSDSSQTIIDCLRKECDSLGVEILYKQKIVSVHKEGSMFKICFENSPPMFAKTVLLATGSSPQGHLLASLLGHTVTPTVPSLFTFNVPNFTLKDLSGICVLDAKVTIKDSCFSQRGPLLIAHFGFTGPAVIKLSAWGARYLAEHNYQHLISINWLPHLTPGHIKQHLVELRKSSKIKQIATDNPFKLPKQLWKHFCDLALSATQKKWTDLSNQELDNLMYLLTAQEFFIEGKSTNKEEFVTCGGVDLKEICFKSMESKLCKGLYFAGEVLDIDGVTGGFNFQNAWTGSFIAGSSASKSYFSL